MENTIIPDWRNNCFSLVRILAALQVLLGHMVGHLKLDVSQSFLKVLGFFSGVPVFFVISGFCIWFSVGKSSSYISYIKKRFLRIYPELWVAVLFEIVTIVVLYRGWIRKDILLFLLSQSTLFQFWTPNSLRGYGCGTPNGSLWTIGIIVQFYIIAWYVRKRFHERRIGLWVCFLLLSIIVGFCLGKTIGFLFEEDGVIAKLFEQTLLPYLWLFLLGCFFAEFYKVLLVFLSRWWYCFILASAIVYLFSCGSFIVGYAVLKNIFFTSGIVGFAFRFPQLAIKKDISYGLFLYHMIVINVFIHLGLTNKLLYCFIAFLISMCFAMFSTSVIGNEKCLFRMLASTFKRLKHTKDNEN